MYGKPIRASAPKLVLRGQNSLDSIADAPGARYLIDGI
jgi:hypothetical protein